MPVKKRVKKMELGVALDRYYGCASVHKRGHLQEFYRINVIKRSALATRYMDEITSVDIADYRDHRLAEINAKTGRISSPATVRLELALLSALYNLARIEWGTCTHNPVEHVRKPSASKGRTRRLTSVEEKRIGNALAKRNSQLLAIFRLAVETAMRQGEILSLRWEYIDLHTGVAHLPLTKNGTERDVPLSFKARSVLRELSGPLSGPVFSYTSNGFKSAWRAVIRRLGIVDLHFHDLRHEAISRFFELGTLNVMEIAAISGHKSLTMLKRYTHLRATQLVGKLDIRKRQAQKFAALFIPYPAELESINEGIVLRFPDLEHTALQASTKEEALEKAAYELLRIQALAARSGERLPPPGDVRVNDHTRILINPL
ncbi:site-specific integrase [Citrobacter koseri]|uniref:site-specific integrase n=1 Tax=Citrobacter koseri TaxID=545 RepID=UPI002B3C61FA|nr:site-specific integrase [Citrobacter koseri]MEB2704072.1 site-specific integrase [Citrobacter koseri]MEB2708997.1 site-specific integrase [Citrobacter koseri]